MSIPSPSHPCWSKLAQGQLAQIRTEQLGLQLLKKRMEASPLTAAQKATEIHSFFTKWEKILDSEIAQLPKA